MISRILGITFLYVVSHMASAGVLTQYDDRTVFEAAAGTLTTETFDENVETLFGGSTFDVGDFTIDATNTFPAFGFRSSDGGTSFVNTTTYLEGVGLEGQSFAIIFDAAISAFGVDLYGVNDGIEKTQAIIGSSILHLPVTEGAQNSFFGVTSDMTFSSIIFRAIADEGAGFDNISFGVTREVPAPASLALIGLGLLGLRLRRKS